MRNERIDLITEIEGYLEERWDCPERIRNLLDRTARLLRWQDNTLSPRMRGVKQENFVCSLCPNRWPVTTENVLIEHEYGTRRCMGSGQPPAEGAFAS